MPLPPGVNWQDLGIGQNVLMDLIEQGQVDPSAMGNVGGAGPIEAAPGTFDSLDMDAIYRDIQKQTEKETADRQAAQKDAANRAYADEQTDIAQQRDARFGNDMAWMDDVFQTKMPTRDEVMAQGTTGDEHAAARQRGAADELFSLYEQGGLGAQERAARAKARRETEGLLRGQREADMQNLAERGMGGSGAEIAALLGSSQAAGERLSAADLQTSADAEQRALDALMGGTQIESGLQKSADNYVQNNAKMMADIASQNTQGRRNAWQASMNNRNQFDMNKLGLQVGAAGQTSSRDALENQAGWGAQRDIAKTDAAAQAQGQAGYNTNITGTNQAGNAGIQKAGETVTEQTGDDKKAWAEGVDGTIKKGTDYLGRAGA